MKKIFIITIPILIILLIIVLLLIINYNSASLSINQPEDSATTDISPSTTSTLNNSTISMKITSPNFENNANIPSKYTCDGNDVNPRLVFENVSDKARSLVLIVDDPDAPVGIWNHWLVFNIPPETKEISENSVSEKASLGINSFGKLEYGGPCPPSGTHRYFFKLYALDTLIDLAPGADKFAIEQEMNGHTIDSCELIGLYNRN